MMRILEVITLGETGGAQTVLVDLIKGISAGGYDVEIDVVFGPGDYLPLAFTSWFQGQAIQVPWLSRSINPYKDIMVLAKLWQLCKTRKYDIVHCHSSKASWLARLAASWAGVPRICMTVHGLSFHPGNPPLIRQVYQRIEKVAIPFANEYVFVSPKDLVEMKALGLDNSRCRYIPNGRSIPPYPIVGLRDLLPIPKEAPIICMVARLSKVKNPMAFLRVAKIVTKKYPSNLPIPNFILIGSGPMYEECQKAVAKADLTNRVHVMGHKVDAGQFFWDADIAFLPSYYEACPLVIIESMATGTPVVASNVGGTESMVKHGQTGYLFSLEHEEEAAQHIINLSINSKMREEMGKSALKHYQKEFSVEIMVDNYVKHLGLQKIKAGHYE
ncbi:MAG: hypothetical protein CVU89_06230 [Firmicutes bacterium HGW-Firmicutes-14]|nr:MAG: hypothetical protein CVU89_06230 [Firmicutes bacterium HGW-Firmicutes-14]